jgi:hypothetical protein
MHEDGGMMGQFVVSSKPAGINENHLDGNIIAFPNPAKDVLYIRIRNFVPETQTIRIYDLFGREIYSFTAIQENFTVLTSQWSRGMYLVSVEHSGKTSFGKFVLE